MLELPPLIAHKSNRSNILLYSSSFINFMARGKWRSFTDDRLNCYLHLIAILHSNIQGIYSIMNYITYIMINIQLNRRYFLTTCSSNNSLILFAMIISIYRTPQPSSFHVNNSKTTTSRAFYTINMEKPRQIVYSLLL